MNGTELISYFVMNPSHGSFNFVVIYVYSLVRAMYLDGEVRDVEEVQRCSDDRGSNVLPRTFS